MPELVVIHFTAMQSAPLARARLCDPLTEVSAHWLLDYDGHAEPLVPEALRAWHAGAGEWAGRGDVNSRSIGIELANNGAEPFPAAQMAALERLLAGILDRWQIPPQGVIGHSDMAPARKSDPGARFDWKRLAFQGLSVWPAPQEAVPDASGFARDLVSFGYPPAAPEILLAAFRLRFAPWRRGPLSPRDCGEAADLARRYPVHASRLT
ncbi:N-acetylmuramoyl-L-alanine amidase [Szabonella alba]|uniref:N-acetylmuramoyl-L-alanine amidase n=1 Tax=Szabonella alba TaxID=2804194 RepID=A0A8K0XZT0_9RHOB|nr:N-acetylmuramoyl-L-alanine amidase [Szabonella alba]MBL4916112.1 N-acetylmuramoyl-L-alanine amidase [Szabonella alba]